MYMGQSISYRSLSGESEAILKWGGGAWSIDDLFAVNILQLFNLIPESLTFYMALENLWGGAVQHRPLPSYDAPVYGYKQQQLRASRPTVGVVISNKGIDLRNTVIA